MTNANVFRLVTVLLVGACGSNEGATAVVDDDPIAALQLIPVPRMVSASAGHLHFEAVVVIVWMMPKMSWIENILPGCATF